MVSLSRGRAVTPRRAATRLAGGGSRRPAGAPRRRLATGARYLLALGLAGLFVAPLGWMLAASLRPLGLPPPTSLEWWPPDPTPANYATVFSLLPFGRYALNSIVVVAFAVPLTLLTASWAGFAMALQPPRVRDALAAVSVAALLVPLMALWLPRFLVLKWLGVLDTPLALILPAALGSSPLYVLLLHWAFRRVPPDLWDAARADGCGPFRLWWSIGLPVVRPALTAVGVLSFVAYWSSYIEPSLYLHNQRYYTLPVALQSLQQLHPSTWPLLMAGATLVTLPVLVLFIVAQRSFLQEHRGSGWLGQ